MKYTEIIKKNNLPFFHFVENIIKNKKLVHAYLFVKNEQNLMNEVMFFAEKIITPLKKQDINYYSDLLIIDGNKETIKKEQILQACHNLKQTALNKNKIKILLIKNIENANLKALNVFLKILENPPLKTFFLLTTNNLSLILNTIKSRVQIIRILSNSLNQAFLENDKNNTLNKYSNIILNLSYLLNEETEIWTPDFQEKIIYFLQTMESSLKNPFILISNLNTLIDKKNYKIIVQLLKIFFLDIWYYQQNSKIIFSNFKNIIQKYSENNFNSQKALQNINNFFINLQTNCSFELQKIYLLINLRLCYG